MVLLKTKEELQKIIVVDNSFNHQDLFPFIPQAELQIESILGSDLYNELLTYYNSNLANTAANDALDKLIPIVQFPLVYFAFFEGFDVFNVSIGANGIGVIQNGQLAPASKSRTDDLKASIHKIAYKGLELLLRFLESNVADYPSWITSDSYTIQHSQLISNAIMFDKYYPIDKSRMTFIKWKPFIQDTESLLIKPIISSELFDELKTQVQSDTLSDDNKSIIEDLSRAICYHSAGLAKADPALIDTSKRYLGMVQHHINDNPDLFPTFANSSIYVTPKTYESFENDEDEGLVMFL